MRIDLSCFYLFLSHFENVSTWNSRLPFAVNAMLNLSCISLSQRPHCFVGRLRREEKVSARGTMGLSILLSESLCGGEWSLVIKLSVCSPSSETQGQSVGSGERARREFSSSGEKAPGYRLSPNYFQNFKRMPAPDWAQKMPKGVGERLQASLCFRHPAY